MILIVPCLPMVTLFIVVGTIVFSLAGFRNSSFFWKYLFNAYGIVHERQYYRIISHAFLHADFVHLGFNMFALYSFGHLLETQFFPVLFEKNATLYFLFLYFGGILASSIPETIRQHKNPSYTSVGASGAVNAVVFSSILIYPQGKISLMFLPALPSWLFGILFLIYSWYMAKKKIDNIGHFAHLWGAFFGLTFTAILKPALIQNIRDLIHF